MNTQPRIFIAGHRGMVGSSILRILREAGQTNIVTKSRSELDLTEQGSVRDFFTSENIDEVYIAAAKVGGIHANNTYPADFIYQNLMIEVNLINSAFHAGVKKLLFLGSSCIYPKFSEQPISEESLLTGVLEETNEPYAVAKIAGIKLCESYNRQYGESHNLDYRSVMPPNLYGPGDNYHPENSHVIPALIRRFHEAKISGLSVVSVWGTGLPRREFMYVDDLARACTHIMSLPRSIYESNTKPMVSHINVGSGEDISIEELANIIKRVVGYSGAINFDASKPDGSPKKLMDNKKALGLGWKARTSLEQGLKISYANFISREIL